MSMESISDTEAVVLAVLGVVFLGALLSFIGISARNRGVEPVTGGEGGGVNAEKWLRWDSGAYLI